jgi:hypothetical protein
METIAMGISSRIFGTSTRTHGDQDRRTRSKVSLTCDSLEGRRLLTTLPVVPLNAPPTAAVSTATTILQEKAPAAFAKYQSDLAKAESSSRVSMAYLNAIALNEAQLDNAIESAGFSASQTSNNVNHVQDIIDASFTGTVNKAGLEAYIQGTSASPQLVKLTLSNMETIAKQSKVSAKEHATLTADINVVGAALGANPDANLGAGETSRDPLIVYYDGQATNFVH